MEYVPYVVAGLVPLIFLFVLYNRDVYQTGSPLIILIAFGWGIIAFGLALQIQSRFFASFLGMEFANISQFIAPVLEEILKGAIILFLVRRAQFSYFVDGAIYGFAIGIGFAIAENYLYLQQGGAAQGLPTAIGRVLSANLMHAAATGLVGITAGIGRFQDGLTFVSTYSVGLFAAMATHAVFNGVTVNESINEYPLLQMGCASGIGLAAAYAIVLIIRLGIKEQKRWIENQLASSSGKRATEVDIAYLADDWTTIEAPIIATFGEETGLIIVDYLQKQAQIGISRAQQIRLAGSLQANILEEEINEKQLELDELGKQISPYHMMTLRELFSFAEYGITE